MACLPKLKCFKKEDGTDIQRFNDTKAAAAAVATGTKEPLRVLGRQMDDRMDHCTKWLRKVSAVTEYEESRLHSAKYLPPTTYLNNLNCNAGRGQTFGSQSVESLGHVSDKMAALNIVNEQRDDVKNPCDVWSASSSDISSISSSIEFKKKKRKKLRSRSSHAVSRHLAAAQRRLSSVSDTTTTESTMSLRTESVVLDLDRTGTNLGISIVGHRNRNGDQGIFVGTVRRDSVAFASGRIRPGSCLLGVNGQELTKMSNESALRTVRTEAQKRGPLRLVLGKFWDVSCSLKDEDLDESLSDGEMLHRPPQEMAKLTYVQPNYCLPPKQSQMVASTRSLISSTYIVTPPISALAPPRSALDPPISALALSRSALAPSVSALALPISALAPSKIALATSVNVHATPIHPSRRSSRAKRQSDRMRNEPHHRSSRHEMTNDFEDHSTARSRRHSLPGIIEPEPNFSAFLPVPPPPPIPPRPFNPKSEGTSSTGGCSAHLPHQTDSRGLVVDSPQTPFRGIDLIKWISNQFSSHIGGISPRRFSQHLLTSGAIVDVSGCSQSGNSSNSQFSENGYYVIVSSQLSDTQIVI